MTDQIFKIVDAYIKLFKYNGMLPIWWDTSKHRLIVVKDPKKLFPVFFKLLVILSFFTIGPALIKAFYLLTKYFNVSAFNWLFSDANGNESYNKFSQPVHLMGIAITVIGGGGAMIFWLVSILWGDTIKNIANSGFDINSVLNDILKKQNQMEMYPKCGNRKKGATIKGKNRGKINPTNYIGDFITFTIIFVIYIASAISIYGVILGADGQYFFIKIILNIQLDSPKFPIFYWLTIKLCSIVILIIAATTSGQVLLGTGYVTLITAWFYLSNAQCIKDVYKGISNGGKSYKELR